jgi:signal transduction histidine kinase
MDIPTLSWSLILVHVVLGGLGALVAVRRRDRAVTIWAFGFGGSSLGFVLLLPHAYVPEVAVPLLGGFFVLAFNVALPLGLGYFVGLTRPWKTRFTVYLVTWALGTVVFTLVPAWPHRATLNSAVIAAFAAEFLFLTWTKGRSMAPTLRTVLLVATGAYVVFHGTRALALLGSQSEGFLDDGLSTAVTLLASLMFSVFWAGILLLIDGDRLQSQLAARTNELVRLNSLKDRVMAMTSHDLRGPLANLQTVWGDLSSRLAQGQCDDADQSLLAMVNRSLEGTQSLLENLFAFAESQNSSPDANAVSDLRWAALVVAEQWQGPAEAKGVALTVEPGSSMPARVDTEAVLTVLRNLVGNAVKFTAAGGAVTLGVSADAGEPWVEVADTGIGMDSETVNGVFSLQSRVSRPGTSGERGSGFGLVLIRELVAGWNGTLEVDSQPGRGTRVRAHFPRA